MFVTGEKEEINKTSSERNKYKVQKGKEVVCFWNEVKFDEKQEISFI